MSSRDRAIAALQGIAIGDALGMPTQLMSREAVAEQFGAITGFEPAAAHHPLAAGLPAGTVTDDTEQALLVARLLIAGRGTIDQFSLAHAFVVWEDEMRKRGSLDVLGPSTKRAVEAVLAAAALGGDRDTVAAVVGTIAGATTGVGAFPERVIATVTTVNSTDLPIADSLLALR
ncbi:MAG: ADP-ribosylglycohydrolase family protein [Salinibacterium sp.]|nr:ADP-ribosylglycohydrolase family protein [Salinibacterium sp.]